MIGRTLAHYRVLEQIDAGGMGVVYRARDEHLERDVALKVLPDGALADEAARSRFHREALSLSRLNHPNIEAVYDFDTQEGVDFLVLEYVPGVTLSDRLAEGPLPGSEILALGRQLADALAAAHARGVIHRDLKPQNLRVTPEAFLKVLDFGLARLLEPADSAAPTRTAIETRGPAGTPPYMAPEQLRGESADARTDIYGAGAVLYEMATGRRPFGEASGAVLSDAILHQTPRPPSEVNPQVPGELSRIILRALAKRPAERQQSARELRDELEGRRRLGLLSAWRQLTFRRAAALTAGLGLIVGVALYYWIAGSGGPLDSLAVLPFTNAGADPEFEYLSDGLADSIIDRVSRLPDVKVIAWYSVSRYKGGRVDPRKVGRDLHVRAVLAGRVGYHAGDLVVNAELIDTRDSRRLWGAQYNRKISEILSIQDEIARQISESLRLRMATSEKQRLAKRPTADPEAYQLYLKGRHVLLNQYSREGIEKAIDYFNRAITTDPGYAQAYAGLADCYYGLSNTYLPPIEAMPRARAAALKAIEMDDTLGAAHTSLAIVKEFYEWDSTGAEREFRRAIELSPSDAQAHLMYGYAQITTGDPTLTRVEIARALELDPLSPFFRAYSGLLLYFARQYDQAEAELKRLVAAQPEFYLPHAYLGLVYERTGRQQEAVEEFRNATRLDETTEALAQLGHACALAGQRAEARTILKNLQTMSVSRYVSPYNIALIFAGLEDRDQAFAWLDKAVEDRSEWMHLISVDPRLDGYRDDPRFEALLRRVGLPVVPR
jgi:serine/threonine-protein kinase